MTKRPVDPSVADFVKALARANAARDIAALRSKEFKGESNADQPPMRPAA
jgi:hypothetical protein